MSIAVLALAFLFPESPNEHIPTKVDWKAALKQEGIKLASLNRSKAKSKRWISPLNCSMEVGSLCKKRIWITVEEVIDEKSLVVRMNKRKAVLRRFPASYTLHKKQFIELAYCVTHRESLSGHGELPVLELIPVRLLRDEIQRLEKLNH